MDSQLQLQIQKQKLFSKHFSLHSFITDKVKLTQKVNDKGVDLIFKKGAEKIIVQCKAYKHQAGPEPVRALWGVREDFNADSALFIAYAGVTAGAREFSVGKDLKFIDVEDLINLSIQAYSE